MGDGMKTQDSTQKVLVDKSYFYEPIDEKAPFGQKVILACKSAGVATTGVLLRSEKFFDHYAPLPVFRK